MSTSTATASTAEMTLETFLKHFRYAPDNLNARADHGMTPLMRAALVGNLTVVEELLRRRVDINAHNADGNNALWLACVSGRVPVVRRLVAAGIFVDNQNVAGATALMYAASSGRHELVAALLELGADPYIHDQDGARAVDMAATFPCLSLLRHTADGVARPQASA